MKDCTPERVSQEKCFSKREVRIMKGFCKDCGQMHLVDANSQKEADTIATDKCDCESEVKWFRLMHENVDMLCGSKSSELEFEPMEQPAIDLVKTACELVHKGFIESVKVSAADSEVVITRVVAKINIVRKRKQQNQMTI